MDTYLRGVINVMTFPEYDPDDPDDPDEEIALPLRVLETPDIRIKIYTNNITCTLTGRTEYKINILRKADGILPVISKDEQGNHRLDWGVKSKTQVERVKINTDSVVTEFCWSDIRLVYNGNMRWDVIRQSHHPNLKQGEEG